MTSASLMHEAGYSKLVLWDNSEGWGWQGGGRGVQDGGNTCAPVADSCQCMAKLSQYCKIIILLLKLIKKKKPSGSAGDIRDRGSIPGSGKSLGGGHETHSSILAWRIPWTEEPGRLQSVESQRVGHNQATKHSTA